MIRRAPPREQRGRRQRHRRAVPDAQTVTTTSWGCARGSRARRLLNAILFLLPTREGGLSIYCVYYSLYVYILAPQNPTLAALRTRTRVCA